MLADKTLSQDTSVCVPLPLNPTHGPTFHLRCVIFLGLHVGVWWPGSGPSHCVCPANEASTDCGPAANGLPFKWAQAYLTLLGTDSRRFFWAMSGHNFLTWIFPLVFFFSQVTLSESRHPQASAVSGLQESSQVSRVDTHQKVVCEIWFWLAWKSGASIE